jgi:hypothetical protein
MPNRLTLLGIAGLTALTLAGCAGHVAIKVDHTPPKEPTGAIASAPATAIKVVNFRDQRGDVRLVHGQLALRGQEQRLGMVGPLAALEPADDSAYLG